MQYTGGGVPALSDPPLSIQMLLFVHGERHKYVDVQILDDAVPEGAERFQLILSKPSSGLELGTNTTGAAPVGQMWDPFKLVPAAVTAVTNPPPCVCCSYGEDPGQR